MTFFVILIVLVAELTWLSFAPLRSDRWIRRWHAWLARNARLREWIGAPGIIVSIGVPVAAVVWVFTGVLADSGFWALVAGVLVLLFSCGPRDLASEIDFYRQTYLDRDDTARSFEPR